MLNLIEIKKSFNKLYVKRELLQSELNSNIDDLVDLSKEALLVDKTILIFQNIIKLKKLETTSKIEKLLTLALQSIFDDKSYSFEIVEEIKRNQVVYEFVVKNSEFSDGVNIMESRGGGLVNIVSFLLRVIVLLLIDKSATRFFVLDEVFNNLSVDFHDNLVAFMKELSKKLNLQVLLVSHQKTLFDMADVVYNIVRSGSTVKIEKITN